MSAATGQSHLIAVGSDSSQARLCDIRSGAFAHALTGHSEAVWACAWSPSSEFLLATGSADQTVRRAGTQLSPQRPRRAGVCARLGGVSWLWVRVVRDGPRSGCFRIANTRVLIVAQLCQRAERQSIPSRYVSTLRSIGHVSGHRLPTHLAEKTTVDSGSFACAPLIYWFAGAIMGHSALWSLGVSHQPRPAPRRGRGRGRGRGG